jgi:hypothetical protein
MIRTKGRPRENATIRIAWSDDEYNYISSAYTYAELQSIVEKQKTRIQILIGGLTA